MHWCVHRPDSTEMSVIALKPAAHWTDATIYLLLKSKRQTATHFLVFAWWNRLAISTVHIPNGKQDTLIIFPCWHEFSISLFQFATVSIIHRGPTLLRPPLLHSRLHSLMRTDIHTPSSLLMKPHHESGSFFTACLKNSWDAEMRSGLQILWHNCAQRLRVWELLAEHAFNMEADNIIPLKSGIETSLSL